MAQSPSARPRALIVEDEVLIALGLQAEIEDLGFDVCGLAANTTQAKSLAMNDRPDLVLMDIYLHGAREGIEAARWLREMYGVPIVFITAYNDDDGLLERIQQQVPDALVLSKPLYGDRLAVALGQLSAAASSAS
jgi:response regulator of citrate/malate metabolism